MLNNIHCVEACCREARAPEMILQYSEISYETDVYGVGMLAAKLYYNETPYFAKCLSTDKDVYDNYILKWGFCFAFLYY